MNSILIVDDDADIGAMLKMMLEYKGYTVFIAERADQVPSILRSKPIRLIVMDMLLSGVNGVDVCRRLKNSEQTSAIPVLMTSAHPQAREICQEAGADEFIAKPFEIEEMLGKIRAFVKPTQ